MEQRCEGRGIYKRHEFKAFANPSPSRLSGQSTQISNRSENRQFSEAEAQKPVPPKKINIPQVCNDFRVHSHGEALQKVLNRVAILKMTSNLNDGRGDKFPWQPTNQQPTSPVPDAPSGASSATLPNDWSIRSNCRAHSLSSKLHCASGRPKLDQFFKETAMRLRVIRPVNSSGIRSLGYLPATNSFSLRLFFSQKAPVEPQTPASNPPRPRPLNEEDMTQYRLSGFHPVSIGDSFKDRRYQVIRKLGFGVYSTVWLCRDHLYHYFPVKLTQGRHNLLP